jgi:hypothetical protein
MDLSREKMLRAMSHSATVQSIFRHPRNARIKRSGGAFYYVPAGREDWRVLSGLLPSLKRTFWPESDTKKLSKRGCKQNGGRGRFYGSIRGTEVHEQLADYIECDLRHFTRRHPKKHGYTERLLNFIRYTMRWTPLCAEFPVFCEALGIGTAIDLICYAPTTQKVVLVEIKTGYAGYFTESDGPMHHALSHLRCSPQCQAAVQLLGGALLVMKHHEISPSALELYVVRVDDTTLDYYRVSESFVRENAAGIVRDLALHNHK